MVGMILKKRFTIGLLVLGVLSASFSFAEEEVKEVVKTKADTNREVAITYAQIYLEQKLYDEAETALLLSLKNDGENGTVLNFLGLVQLQQKNYSQACYSFQTASIVFQEVQNRIYSLYNLADCLHQGGRRQEAINVLKDLAKKEEGISNSAEKTLELIEAGVISSREPLPPYRKRSRGQYRLTGAISGGFDTNVLLVEEDVAAGYSLSDRGSFYYTPSIQFGYLGRFLGRNLDLRLVSAYTSYVATNSTGYNNLYNRLDMYFGSGNVRWDLFGDVIFLNNSGSFAVYNYDVGVMWQQTRKTASNETITLEVPVKYQKFVLSAGTSTDNDRSGGDVQMKLGYRRMNSEQEYFSISGMLDNQYAIGKNYRLSGITIPFTKAIELPFFSSLGFLNTFSGELGGQLYWQSELNRRDWWFKAGTGISKTLWESWYFSVDFYFFRNNSNVDAATYSKGVTSFLLSHGFL